MSTITPTPVNDRTFNPWPGRALRLILVIVVTSIWSAIGKFVTFQNGGSDDYSSYQASWSDYVNGYAIAAILTITLGVALGVICLVFYVVGDFVWSDFKDDDSDEPYEKPASCETYEEDEPVCRNHDCLCVEHRQPAVFNTKIMEWDYPECADTECTCVDHQTKVE